MKLSQKLPVCILIVLFISSAICENKYSRSANEKYREKKKTDVDFRTLEKPFRMNKLNILWTKAQQRLEWESYDDRALYSEVRNAVREKNCTRSVGSKRRFEALPVPLMRLTDPKLKSLYSDLMIQDKEELTLKRVRTEGGDKEGMKEAELRRKLTNLMSVYGLREHFEDAIRQKEHPALNSALDDHINKSLFKDKKLNQLWAKAETSGFSSEELSALKEEFYHHQDKIDQYYDLLSEVEAGKSDEFKNALNEEEMDQYNEISQQLETNEISKDYLDRANLVRVKHRGLRDGYDRLNRISARGPENKEFIEPKVQGLWRIATEANFTVDELASLKVELQHYESRLLKLRHIQADHVSNLEQHRGKVAATGDKLDNFAEQQQMIKKHSRKVEKMHAEIEGKILGRHNEL